MALFHKKQEGPELYIPAKHKKLIEGCFADPKAVFQAIDKETGNLKNGFKFVDEKKVEAIAHFLNASNAEEFERDFKDESVKRQQEIQKLVRENQSKQFLRSTDHTYFTAMINIGTAGTNCLHGIVAKAEQEAEEQRQKAEQLRQKQEAAEQKKREAQERRDQAAQTAQQKREERENQAQQKRDTNTIESFKKKNIKTAEWNLKIVDVSTKAGELIGLNTEISTDLENVNNLNNELQALKAEGPDKKDEYEAKKAEAQAKVRELKTKLEKAAKLAATINTLKTKLLNEFSSSRAAAAEVKEGDVCMDAATEVINAVEAAETQLANINFDFKIDLANREQVLEQLENMEREM